MEQRITKIEERIKELRPSFLLGKFHVIFPSIHKDFLFWYRKFFKIKFTMAWCTQLNPIFSYFSKILSTNIRPLNTVFRRYYSTMLTFFRMTPMSFNPSVNRKITCFISFPVISGIFNKFFSSFTHFLSYFKAFRNILVATFIYSIPVSLHSTRVGAKSYLATIVRSSIAFKFI